MVVVVVVAQPGEDVYFLIIVINKGWFFFNFRNGFISVKINKKNRKTLFLSNDSTYIETNKKNTNYNFLSLKFNQKFNILIYSSDFLLKGLGGKKGRDGGSYKK